MIDAYANLVARLNPSQISRDELLGPYTTFRIGGPADILYNALTADDLSNAVLIARELGIPWFVLGLGA
ncbi:MAG: UDP-N-acetylenolpyruvoylglucosamine reductase, partial [Gemmatimonadaceae bacterium]